MSDNIYYTEEELDKDINIFITMTIYAAKMRNFMI